jgi:hypothetical protein
MQFAGRLRIVENSKSHYETETDEEIEARFAKLTKLF